MQRTRHIEKKGDTEGSNRLVGTLPQVKTIWKWLTPAARRLICATLLALPVTIFLGQGSWQALFSFISVRTADSPYWALDWATNTVGILLLLLIISTLLTKLKSSAAPLGSGAHDPEAYRLLDRHSAPWLASRRTWPWYLHWKTESHCGATSRCKQSRSRPRGALGLWQEFCAGIVMS